MVNLDHNRPFYKVEFFEPDSSNPKLILSPNIFPDTEHPEDRAKMSPEIYISHISVDSGLGGTINTAECEINHNVGADVHISVGFDVKVYFGFYDKDKSQGPDFSLVFTGSVTEIKHGLERSIVYCKGGIRLIAAKKQKITFSKMMGLNEIIEKFAIELGGLSSAENGIFDPGINKQPGFGISAQEPLLTHINTLAGYGGMDVFTDVFDNFHAVPWNSSNLKEISSSETSWLSARDRSETENRNRIKHKIIFDSNLIDINFEMLGKRYSGVEIVSLMPFPDDQTHTIDPVKVEYLPASTNNTTSTRSPSLPQPLPLDRYIISHITRKDGEKIAENLYWQHNRLTTGSIKMLGAPQIRIGDGMSFVGEIFVNTPYGNIIFDDRTTNTKLEKIVFQVTQVDHRFDIIEGYTTTIKFGLKRSF